MRHPIIPTEEEIRIDRGETIGNPPSFEEVTQEIGVTILVYLLLAVAAELLTRRLPLG